MNNNFKGIFAIILLSFLFASVGIFSRVLQESFALFQQVYLRMLVGVILGFIFFFNDIHFSKLMHIPKKDWIIMILRALSYYVVGVTLFTLAILNTTLGNVSLLQSLPIVAIFGVLFFKEKLTRWKLFFILLSLLGVTFISINNIHEIFIWGKGQTFSLISGVFFAFSFMSRKWQSDYLNNKEITQIVLFFAVIFLLIGSFFFHESLPTHGWNWLVVGALLVSGLYNVVMLYLINYGFQHVKPLVANNLLTLETFFAIILGLLIYKEIPHVKDIFGGGMIIAAVIGMNYLERN